MDPATTSTTEGTTTTGTSKHRLVLEENDGKLPKIVKVDDSSLSDMSDFFRRFNVIKVLNQNVQHKKIFIHGRIDGNDEDAILILEKTPLSEKVVVDLLKTKITVVQGMENDIYKTFELIPPPHYASLKSTVIYPATAKHLSKYSSHMGVIVHETPCDYQRVVIPYIASSSFSRQWVYNILEKRSEVERILFEDDNPETGFILLPDMKWDGKQVDDLYLVAFVKDNLLHSIRDLTSSHIPLLKNIRDKSLALIKSKYGVAGSSVRSYLHYVPSYYHLHVHFTHVDYDAPGINAGRAHLLDEIIDNLELFDHYYQRKTLTYILHENDELYHRYREAGKL